MHTHKHTTARVRENGGACWQVQLHGSVTRLYKVALRDVHSGRYSVRPSQTVIVMAGKTAIERVVAKKTRKVVPRKEAVK
jgi:hypothetical protein